MRMHLRNYFLKNKTLRHNDHKDNRCNGWKDFRCVF